MKREIKNSTYIIITNSMHLMGGAELYAIRRANYLKDKKNCKVVFVLKERMEENGFWQKEMKDYQVIHLPEMNRPILYYSKKKSLRIIQTIVSKIGKLDKDYYIETHTIHLAGWAELLAQKVNGFNVLYFLNDSTIKGKIRFYPHSDFYEYKLENKEVIGLNRALLSIVFQKKIKEVYNQYVNIGFSKKELSLKSKCSKYSLEEIKNYDFIIGTVARLEKEYIKVLIEEVISFSEKNKTKKIALLIGGDTPNIKLKKKYDKFFLKNKEIKKRYANLDILHLGYINPLGIDFFRKLDVFVGQGTAVVNAISEKTATIVMMNSKKTNGILGIDTDLFGYSDQTTFYNLQDKLNKLLNSPDYLQNAKEKGYNLYMEEYEQQVCFQKFDNYISQLSSPSRYSIAFKMKDRIRDASLYKLRRFYLKLRYNI